MMTMAIVHLVGYRLFVGQAERGYGQRVLVMDHLWPHLKKALFWQLSFMAVSSLVLDGGQMFRICLVAAIAHWLSIASIATRSPGALSVGDIRVIRWGYPAAFGIALVFNFVQNQ